jgi:hypothetical protein
MRTPFNIAPVAVKFTDISTAIGTWSELLGHAHAFRCSDVRKSSPPGYHRLVCLLFSRVPIAERYSEIFFGDFVFAEFNSIFAPESLR